MPVTCPPYNEIPPYAGTSPIFVSDDTSLTNAVSSLNPGERIVLNPGTYTANITLDETKSGYDSVPTSIVAQTPGSVNYTGRITISNTKQGPLNLPWSRTRNIFIHGLNFTGGGGVDVGGERVRIRRCHFSPDPPPPGTGTRYALNIAGAKNIKVDYCEFTMPDISKWTTAGWTLPPPSSALNTGLVLIGYDQQIDGDVPSEEYIIFNRCRFSGGLNGTFSPDRPRAYFVMVRTKPSWVYVARMRHPGRTMFHKCWGQNLTHNGPFMYWFGTLGVLLDCVITPSTITDPWLTIKSQHFHAQRCDFGNGVTYLFGDRHTIGACNMRQLLLCAGNVPWQSLTELTSPYREDWPAKGCTISGGTYTHPTAAQRVIIGYQPDPSHTEQAKDNWTRGIPSSNVTLANQTNTWVSGIASPYIVTTPQVTAADAGLTATLTRDLWPWR